jgi:hypothetical protein
MLLAPPTRQAYLSNLFFSPMLRLNMIDEVILFRLFAAMILRARVLLPRRAAFALDDGLLVISFELPY